MRINFLIWTMGGGGAERVLSDVLSFHPENTSVSLSLFTRGNMPYDIDDTQICVYSEMATGSYLKRLLYLVGSKTLFPLYMHFIHLRKQHYDVSVSFLSYMNCVNIIASSLSKTPIVVSIRVNLSAEKGSIYLSIIHFVHGFLLNLFKPYVIVNSEENREALIKKYRLKEDKTICIYNPKNIQKIEVSAHEYLSDSFFKTDELILLTVGRLVPQKGHVHLIRIFSHLRKSIPCRLVICGVGKLNESLKKLTDDLGISDSVLFTGWCDNPYKYMKRADIFVFPSLYEGQPNALIEALICGCPIVSTDCDYGPREVLANGKYGLLSKKLSGNLENPVTTELTDAEQDMYDKILYLMQHPEERKRLRDLSSEQIYLFDKEQCIKKYYDVFRAAAEGKSLNNLDMR